MARPGVLPLECFAIHKRRAYKAMSLQRSISIFVPIVGFSIFVCLLLATPPLALTKHLPICHSSVSIYLLVLCLAVAWYSTSTVWLAQRVTYPLFGLVGKDRFEAYYAAYETLIPVPVICPALLLMSLSVLFIWFRPLEVPSWVAWSGLAMETGNALSTVALQLPAHKTLSRSGFDTEAHLKLVKTNWIRTFGVTLHALLLPWAVLQILFARGAWWTPRA